MISISLDRIDSHQESNFCTGKARKERKAAAATAVTVGPRQRTLVANGQLALSQRPKPSTKTPSNTGAAADVIEMDVDEIADETDDAERSKVNK